MDDFGALARLVGLSDARLGYALGLTGERAHVSARVRQWKRGARPVPAETLSLLRALVIGLDGERLPDTDEAITGLLERALPPEWIIGTAAPGSDEAAPEYLVHTRRPRFICRVVDEIEDGAPLSAFAYNDGDWTLCDFHWLDRAPESEELSQLLKRAMESLG